jgi:CheY-like chemotaxis protein
MSRKASDRLRGIHVLVVEDHRDTLELYEMVLQADGAVVTTASTPLAAFELCRAVRPEIVVTDLSFGGAVRDGVWLLTQLRMQQDLKRVRVIAVTGRDLGASWTQQHTFDAVLVKPVEPRELCQLVAQLTTSPP